jgi:Undecaprenyl-phosphate glucose phosphotransferase
VRDGSEQQAISAGETPALVGRSHANTPIYIVGLLRVLDFTAAVMASIGAYALRHSDGVMPADYRLATLLGALLSLQFLQMAGGYDFSALCRRSGQLGRCLSTSFLTATALATLSFLLKNSDDFSRLWALVWFFAATAAFSINRVALSSVVSRWNRDGRFRQRIAVIGMGTLPHAVAARLAESERARVVRVFSDAEAVPLEAAVRFLREGKADEALVALPFERDLELSRVLRGLAELPIDVHVCPGVPELPKITFPTVRGFGVPTWSVFERPLKGWKQLLKRVEDVVLSLALLLVLGPLMLLTAMLIKCDSSGPVLFRQRRHGFNNEPFEVLKFRTMWHRAEDPGVPPARRNDARVTRLGRFLRRTSLDELPQLLNVLSGQMSLVGPRPHAVVHGEHYSRLVNLYFARHRVKPGITGWAQVNGLRGEADVNRMRLRVEHDLHYVENWSVLFDLKILLLTLRAVLRSENAH